MSKRNVGINNGRWSGGDRSDTARAGTRAQLREEIELGKTAYFLNQEQVWMEKCAEVEGLASFDAWYGNDDNVPARGQASARVKLLQARYESLKTTHTEAFYWLKVEDQEARNCMEIEGPESFREWWNDDGNFPASTTPKERVEMIRARITAFLTNDGTTQVQDRVRALQSAIITGKAINRAEITNELADLGNHLQRIGVPISGEEGEI